MSETLAEMDGEMESERRGGKACKLGGSRALKLRAGRWETLAEADIIQTYTVCIAKNTLCTYTCIQMQECVRRNAHANTAKTEQLLHHLSLSQPSYTIPTMHAGV